MHCYTCRRCQTVVDSAVFVFHFSVKLRPMRYAQIYYCAYCPFPNTDYYYYYCYYYSRLTASFQHNLGKPVLEM